jgi:dihydrofolate reductase|tara:strand:- start:2648 stop:3127 length:480 start_codon:yes stop_codon:yes gene_type:complete
MDIFLIAAVDRNLAIGKDGKIPWHIKEDLQYFKKNTLNTSMIMGRSTFESIGKPLPDRKNIVMTKSPSNREGVIEVTSATGAIEEANKTSNKISVIGGESIYKAFLPLANKLLLTEINITVEDADTFFPSWEKDIWIEQSRIDSVENGIEYSFVEYLRN